METPLQIFCCYARDDQPFLMTLKKHLMPLQREGLVIVQADIDISPGEEWEQKISHFLHTSQMILLLLSPDFLASEYCYSKEMIRAIERHERGDAYVIPIILRPVSWQATPPGKLQALPSNAEPVTSRHWHTLDDAFLNVVEGIKKSVLELNNRTALRTPLTQPSVQANVSSMLDTADHQPKQLPLTVSPSAMLNTSKIPPTPTKIALIKRFSGVSVNGCPWGRHVAIQDIQKNFQIWDIDLGKHICTFHNSLSVTSIHWSSDSKRIASILPDRVSVHIWDAETGRSLTTLEGKVEDDRYRIWPRTFNPSEPHRFHLIHNIVWSPDSSQIVSVRYNHLKVFDVVRSETLSTYSIGDMGVYEVAWSPNQKYLASQGYKPEWYGSTSTWNYGTERTRIWNATTGQESLSYGDGERVYCTSAIAWSPDSQMLASSAVWQDEKETGIEVTIRQVITGEVISVRKYPSTFMRKEKKKGRQCNLLWTKDGLQCVYKDEQKDLLYVWEVLTGKMITIDIPHEYYPSPKLSPNGKYIALYGLNREKEKEYEKNIEIWSTIDGKHVCSCKGPSRIKDGEWSLDSTRFISKTTEGDFQIWQLI